MSDELTGEILRVRDSLRQLLSDSSEQSAYLYPHVTLAGSDAPLDDPLVDRLSDEISRIAPMTIRLGGVGLLPGNWTPHIAVVSPYSTAELGAIFEALNQIEEPLTGLAAGLYADDAPTGRRELLPFGHR